MMPRVVNVAPLPKYRLHVEFDDGVSRTIDHGVSRTIDHSGEFDGEVFQPLRDAALFRQVTVHEFGAVCWPNGPDLAPDAMHNELISEPTSPPGLVGSTPCFCGQIESVGRKSPKPGQMSRPR
jgi:hypothetical protein